MTSFIIYSIETAISMSLFYATYWLLLKNDTFFRLKRVYLICTVIAAMLLPLLNITFVTGESSFLSSHLLSPIEHYKQQISGVTHYGQMSPLHNTMHHRSIIDQENGTKADQAEQKGKIINVPVFEVLSTAPNSTKKGGSPDTGTIIMIIYFTGVVIFVFRLIAGFIMISRYARGNAPQLTMDKKLIRIEEDIAPFSFWNIIFIGNKTYTDNELSHIVSHESVHIRQKHSLDMVFFNLLIAFQWFNPFVWLYRRAVKINHEYLADEGALDSGVELAAYQYALLNEALGANTIEVASNYNLSIKKRITMMMKKRSPKFAALKTVVAMPLLFVLFSAFAFNSSASSLKEQNRGDDSKIVISYKDSGIKRVDVPVDLLKQLEGEYISSNEGGRVHKITFTEVSGEMYGNDNGYIYKIIPVGGGKFVNPDDRATLVFDSKDKNALSLVLFGNRFKKVPSTKKSLAFEVLALTTKEGIDAGVKRYNQLKGSADVYLFEAEMNYAGYQLLQEGKTKEAVALFKLNTEAFPKSFNVYDSYGEALLAMGEKNLALENYKKSLELNPVLPSAIKVLSEAGLYTDTVIKKITAAEMALLEGDYYATTKPTATRKVTIKAEKGILMGEDKGYKYQLVYLGQGRFINPDDGEKFIFNTSDRNAITLLMFGNLPLRKALPGEKSNPGPAIKKVDMPVDRLKQLTGEYVSTDVSQRTRTITFVLVNGELIGDDNGYTYKLIPVGGNKFINPDDDATLDFNTTNKDAITLLLFGKINLKKVK